MQTIVSLGKKARDSTLSIDDMAGGTFTISNGGVYGSLLSTPIINPPQSAILGMHSIQQRPMVIDGEIKARPMMYIALTYDHRLIDGREVCFTPNSSGSSLTKFCWVLTLSEVKVVYVHASECYGGKSLL